MWLAGWKGPCKILLFKQNNAEVKESYCVHLPGSKSKSKCMVIGCLVYCSIMKMEVKFHQITHRHIPENSTFLEGTHQQKWDVVSRGVVNFITIKWYQRQVFPYGRVTCRGDYRRGFGLDDWIYWHLIHTTRNYRQLQRYHWSAFFTVHRYAHTAVLSRILATDL
jgi:hypothetical protein